MYVPCAYFLCVHTHPREKANVTSSDLDEQYVELDLLDGLLFLQLFCRFEFFQNEKLKKKRRGGEWRKRSRRGRGLETFEVCNHCEDAAATTHCPQTLPWPG